MPEGHTLHRMARTYTRRFAGHPTHSSSPQGRFAPDAAVLDGLMMLRAEAWGKHLFCHFGTEHLPTTVHVHLGLLGKVTYTDGAPAEPRGALRWRLSTDPVELGGTADLRGPTDCRIVDEAQVDAILARLGPDPLRVDDPATDPDLAWQRISRSRAPIAGLLMDQSVIAGVGNVYRAEVLFRHRLDPLMTGRQLKRREWDAIWSDLVELMAVGLRVGRIETLRPEDVESPRVRREEGRRSPQYVYRRTGEPCLLCGTTIRKSELANRNLFWCPGCQRRTRRAG